MEIDVLLVIIVVTGIIALMGGTLFKEDKEVEELYNAMTKPCRHNWSIHPVTDLMTCITCNKVAGK